MADTERKPTERKVSSGSGPGPGPTSEPEPEPEPESRPGKPLDEPTADDAAANRDLVDVADSRNNGGGIQSDEAQAQHDEPVDVVVHNEEDMVMY